MTAEIDRVAVEILSLPASARAYLAHRLISSLDDDADANTDAEWQETLDRRWKEIESGRVECPDALAVIDEIKAQIRAQAAHSS